MKVLNMVKPNGDYPFKAINAGIKVCKDDLTSKPHACDCIITWNNYGTSKKLARQVKDVGGQHIVIENGYLRAGDGYYAMGVNGYSGLDERTIPNVDVERFKKLDMDLYQDVTNEAGYILVCGQRGGDYSPLAMSNKWPTEIIREIRKHTSKLIIYKPHPGKVVNPDLEGIDNVELVNRDEDLSSLIAEAYCVVVHSSNSAHSALALGIPVIATNPNAIFCTANIVETRIERITDMYRPTFFHRERYFENLACRQFHKNEISGGDAWRQLTH